MEATTQIHYVISCVWLFIIQMQINIVYLRTKRKFIYLSGNQQLLYSNEEPIEPKLPMTTLKFARLKTCRFLHVGFRQFSEACASQKQELDSKKHLLDFLNSFCHAGLFHCGNLPSKIIMLRPF